MTCNNTQKKLCGSNECLTCYNRSFASYDGLTDKGNLKIACFNIQYYTGNPNSIFKNSYKKYHFICDVCTHDFDTELYSVSAGSWCPYCLNRKICQIKCNICYYKSFASYLEKTKTGKLKINCWDYDKNKLVPYQIFKNSNKKWSFICDVCEHSFETPLNDIVQNNRWCPYCRGQRICKNIKDCDACVKRTFAGYIGKTPNGKLKVECWSHENKIQPYEVLLKSRMSFRFICDNCEHEFNSVLYNISNGRWCPYCSNPPKKNCNNKKCKICTSKTLASYQGKTKAGSLKIECWDYQRNIDRPEDLFKSSEKKRWFNCDTCFHSFILDPAHISKGIWCPYCAEPSRLLCSSNECTHCFNRSFASFKGKTQSGNLKVNYFDTEKNKLTPREIFKVSGKKYWFNCDKCNNSFQSTLAHITKMDSWCPTCKNKTEGIFKEWFNGKYPHKTLKYQPKYLWCKNPDTDLCLPFDFVIEITKTIIEIDGEQHFTQVSNWKSPENRFEFDKYKMAIALKKGYTVIRILQEDIWFDKNNWKDKFEQYFKYYDVPEVICIGCDVKYEKYNDLDHVIATGKEFKCDNCSGKFYFESSFDSHNCDDYCKYIRTIYVNKLCI